MYKLKNISLATMVSVLYKHIVEKGIFAAFRFSKGELQTHFDWDSPEYSNVMDDAKRVKYRRAHRHPDEKETTVVQQSKED